MSLTEDLKILISQYIDGELSAAEKAKAEEALINSKEAQNYYKELQGISFSLKEWSDEKLSPDLEQKMQKTIEGVESTKPQMRKTPSMMAVGGGTIFIILFVLVLSLQVYNKETTKVIQSDVATLEVEKGQKDTFAPESKEKKKEGEEFRTATLEEVALPENIPVDLGAADAPFKSNGMLAGGFADGSVGLLGRRDESNAVRLQTKSEAMAYREQQPAEALPERIDAQVVQAPESRARAVKLVSLSSAIQKPDAQLPMPGRQLGVGDEIEEVKEKMPMAEIGMDEIGEEQFIADFEDDALQVIKNEAARPYLDIKRENELSNLRVGTKRVILGTEADMRNYFLQLFNDYAVNKFFEIKAIQRMDAGWQVDFQIDGIVRSWLFVVDDGSMLVDIREK